MEQRCYLVNVWFSWLALAQADAPALRVPDTPVIAPVTFYKANLCPFFPIVRRRLADLRQRMNVDLREVDVTLRADVIHELAAFLCGTVSPA
jgi:hypothetical protein